MRAHYVFLFTLILSVIAGCGQSSSEQSKSAEVKLLSVDDLPRFLEDNRDVQFVDVRTPAEVADGTIEGASNIDFRSQDFSKLIQELDKNKKTVIFCARGGRSATACKQMKEMGFTQLYDVDGGYTKYISVQEE